MGKKLEGKIAIVTGASKGIGASIAEVLGSEGASVIVNYASSKEGAERVVNKIKDKGGKAIAIQANMSNPKEIERLFSETKSVWGKLDILINNAGIYEFSSLENVTPEHFHKTFDLNVMGLLLATKEAVKHFKNSGNIVNISSMVSTLAPPEVSVYSASKAAVDAITKSLSKELGPKNIRINAVNPGIIETEGTKTSGILESEMRQQVEAATPLRRIGQPQDVASAVLFLASDDSSWITGETLYVSGGYV